MTDLGNIECSVTPLEGLRRRVDVMLTADQVEREFHARLRAVGQAVNIKGYRPGKIPEPVLQQRFGERVRHEVVDHLVRSSLHEAVDRLKLRPVSEAKIEAPAPGKGESLAFSATFEVLPDITLAGLETIPVERPEPLIDDADLDFVIGKLRHQHVEWHRTGRAARTGDRVTVNSSGLVDGQPVEGISGEQIPIVLGEDQFLPEIQRPILGIVAGEERTFDVDMPPDFGYADIAGRTVQLTVRALEVAEPVLPALDAGFMRRVGCASADPDEFRAFVAEITRTDFMVRARAEVRRQLFAHLVGSNPIPLPDALVEQEATNLKFASMRLLSIVDPDKARPAGHFRPLAEERVRTELLIGAICDAFGIELDQQRVMQRLSEMSRQPSGQFPARPDPELRSGVEGDVREDQVAEWLEQRAAVTPKPMTYRQLLAAEPAAVST